MIDPETIDSILQIGAYLTADLAGIGGELKQQPQDFIVEEIPAYEPCGEGEHLFLWIEKTNVDHISLMKHLADTLNIGLHDIGIAGRKDRVAITRQFVSVPATCSALVAAVDRDRIRVLSATQHRNKLRTGHLQGNRFDILIRNPIDSVESIARDWEERTSRFGFPNYFGIQRFGANANSVVEGLALLSGKRSRTNRQQKKFLISAVQSMLFNQVLGDRIASGQTDSVSLGDVMQVRESGGLFVVEDIERETCRQTNREIVATGPMYGPKMRTSVGEVAGREDEVLQRWNLTVTDFARFKKVASGTRRALLEWPNELELMEESNGLRLRFCLNSGVYATTMLRELMKN